MIQIDDADRTEMLEARGFHFAGVFTFNPRTNQVALLWADRKRDEARVLAALKIDPNTVRTLDLEA